jgi:hypothetical protein
MRPEILLNYKEFDKPEKVDSTTISNTFIKRPERGKTFHKITQSEVGDRV